jgi:hypothetical protein
MTSWNEAEELRRDALGKDVAKSDRLNERERRVRRDFWAKLKAVEAHTVRRRSSGRLLLRPRSCDARSLRPTAHGTICGVAAQVLTR